MGAAERNKGARGERELRDFLIEHGWEAHRGRQYHGGADSPDVKVANFPFHIECKRVERLALWPAIDQATGDCPEGKRPLVVHRPNGKPWLAILYLEDLLKIIKPQGETK